MRKILLIILIIPLIISSGYISKPVRVNAFSVVQTANNSTDGTTSVVVTISSSGSNNLIVLTVGIQANRTVSSLVDNLGTTYSLSGSQNEGSASPTFTLKQYYAVVSSGVTTVTLTTSGIGSQFLIVDEYSGNATTSVSDVTTTNSGIGTSLSVSLSPSLSGELIVSSLMAYLANSGSSWTAGTNYTLYGTSAYSGSYPVIRSQYRLSGTTSETAPATVTYLVNIGWAEITTAFNISSGVVSTNHPVLGAVGN